MSGSVSFSPYATTSPQNTFLLQTQGYVQGALYDDPSTRMELMGGYLAPTETLPMWGGVPMSENVNVTGSMADGLGSAMKRATSQANIIAWSTYNQAGSMVLVPGNSAPMSFVNDYVAYVRVGTQQRIAVAADPALVAAAAAGILTNTPIYWDVTNYRVTLVSTGGNFLLPTSALVISTNSNSKILSYNAGTGALSWTAGSAAILKI